ncbi:MAG: dUTP diphosphatase [Parachlamydiales bacterium]
MKKIKIPTLVQEGAEVPTYGTPGAAGADVRAHLEKGVTLNPGQRILIPTGLKMAIPEGYEIQVRPRSGLALKQGITVLNTPGTIDSDYRGEIGVILIHLGQEPFVIEPGMRIAQLVLAPVVSAEFIEHEELLSSARGLGGFGSTGQ